MKLLICISNPCYRPVGVQLAPRKKGEGFRRAIVTIRTVGKMSKPRLKLGQTKHCSKPCNKMSLGKSMPMNTILLILASPSAHMGPKSLPMSWCTP